MLAKAALWMLTAYMFIAIISLLFPGSNQPEVRNVSHTGTSESPNLKTEFGQIYFNVL